MAFYPATKKAAPNRVVNTALTAVMLTALILGANTCGNRSLKREITQKASSPVQYTADTNAYRSKRAWNASTDVNGMIDAHAYHCNTATWPATVAYVDIGADPIRIIDREAAAKMLTAVDGMNINNLQTADMGNFLVDLNSRMYNEGMALNQTSLNNLSDLVQIREDINKLLNGRNRKALENEEELRQLADLEGKEKKLRADMAGVHLKDVPGLIMVPTMDMEFAHIDGYDGEPLYRRFEDTGHLFFKTQRGPVFLDDDLAMTFQNWKRQVSDVETAALSNPLRLFPLFSYDPRRYRLSDSDTAKNGWGTWKEPFTRIAGHSDSAKDIKKIWLGFCMNPTLGFQPFDEFCDYLPMFYRECEKNGVPVLASCVAGGFTTHDAAYYHDNLDKRMIKNDERYKMILEKGLSSRPRQDDDSLLSSYRYYGGERIFNDKYYHGNMDYFFEGLDYFYMYYGHPRNWIPVLEFFPDLRLCLAGFGGNSEWRLAEWSSDSAEIPTRQWLRVIIKLSARYKNVYADISGLNIYDEKIRDGLLELLKLIQDDKDNGFKHLKYKLIFGSGWYSTYLTDAASGGKSVDGRDSVKHSYGNYCREFKKLFDMADKDGNGELWEYVSLFNPWNFYGLSKDKIDKIRRELPIDGD